MQITILNGNPQPADTSFEGYLSGLSEKLEAGGHQVSQLVLRNLDIQYCVGCFGCWVKTPGKCVTQDDSRHVLKAAVNSQLLIAASPVLMGFTSAVLKKTLDKMIPLVHPYTDIIQNEIHHKARYKHYPVMGLILEGNQDFDQEDQAIIVQSFRRLAINFRSRLAFMHLTSDPVEEIYHEINHL